MALSDSGECVLIADANVVELEAIDHPALVFRGLRSPVRGTLIYAGHRGIIWCGGVRRSPWTSLTHWPLKGQSNVFNMSRPTENTPDAFVVSRTVLQTLGGLDGEQFPMHYEEANLGARIRKPA